MGNLFSTNQSSNTTSQQSGTSQSNLFDNPQFQSALSQYFSQYSPGNIGSTSTPNIYQSAAGGNQAGVAGSLGTATGVANQVATQGLTPQAIQAQMSPYISSVVNPTLAAFAQQNQQGLSQLAGNQAVRGALGNSTGSEAAYLAGVQPSQQATIAGLYNQGYGQAQQAALQSLQAQLSGASAAGSLAGAGTQANLGLNTIGQGLYSTSLTPYTLTSQMASGLSPWLQAAGMSTSATGSGTGNQTNTPGIGSVAAGLAGLGLSAFSDERVKENIRRVGSTFDGQPVYSYNFPGGPTQIGLLAQDVERVMPEAVGSTPEGIKTVDYDLATAPAAFAGGRGAADGGMMDGGSIRFGGGLPRYNGGGAVTDLAPGPNGVWQQPARSGGGHSDFVDKVTSAYRAFREMRREGGRVEARAMGGRVGYDDGGMVPPTGLGGPFELGSMSLGAGLGMTPPSTTVAPAPTTPPSGPPSSGPPSGLDWSPVVTREPQAPPVNPRDTWQGRAGQDLLRWSGIGNTGGQGQGQGQGGGVAQALASQQASLAQLSQSLMGGGRQGYDDGGTVPPGASLWDMDAALPVFWGRRAHEYGGNPLASAGEQASIVPSAFPMSFRSFLPYDGPISPLTEGADTGWTGTPPQGVLSTPLPVGSSRILGDWGASMLAGGPTAPPPSLLPWLNPRRVTVAPEPGPGVQGGPPVADKAGERVLDAPIFRGSPFTRGVPDPYGLSPERLVSGLGLSGVPGAPTAVTPPPAPVTPRPPAPTPEAAPTYRRRHLPEVLESLRTGTPDERRLPAPVTMPPGARTYDGPAIDATASPSLLPLSLLPPGLSEVTSVPSDPRTPIEVPPELATRELGPAGFLPLAVNEPQGRLSRVLEGAPRFDVGGERPSAILDREGRPVTGAPLVPPHGVTETAPPGPEQSAWQRWWRDTFGIDAPFSSGIWRGDAPTWQQRLGMALMQASGPQVLGGAGQNMLAQYQERTRERLADLQARQLELQSVPEVVRTLEAAGLQRGTPEFQRALLRILDRDRAETAFDQQSGKTAAERMAEAEGAVTTGQTRLTGLEQLAGLVADPSIYQGTGANILVQAQGVARALGIPVPSSAGAEAFQAISSQLVLGMRQAVGGMPGAMSDRDLAFLQHMTPALTTSREGNALIIRMAREIEDYRIRYNAEMASYLRQQRSTSGLGAHMATWTQANPLRSTAIQQALGGSSQQTPPGAPGSGQTGTGQSGPVALDATALTAAQLNALPTGARIQRGTKAYEKLENGTWREVTSSGTPRAETLPPGVSETPPATLGGT